MEGAGGSSGVSPGEVCRMVKEERKHLLDVMGLPKNEDTDHEVDIEELTSSKDEGDLGYAAPFMGHPEQPEIKDQEEGS